MRTALQDFILSESAVTAVEYGGIAAIMLVVVVTGASSIGNVLIQMWDYLNNNLF